MTTFKMSLYKASIDRSSHGDMDLLLMVSLLKGEAGESSGYCRGPFERVGCGVSYCYHHQRVSGAEHQKRIQGSKLGLLRGGCCRDTIHLMP